MAPKAPSSSRQSARNDPEQALLLEDTPNCSGPKNLSRHEIRDTSGVSRRLKLHDAAKMTIRKRIRSQAHGQHFSLLVGQPDIDRKEPTKNNQSKERTPSQEALRLDWMRRLRPKPHRRA
ncbi:hypothetical protein N7451_012830 [Penicillium sp. IBT 35674x]|nr:hypothetical protein N7451_012830 [Penicillium sp. IBT 35674x]